jgi:flagellar hook-associated protein 2
MATIASPGIGSGLDVSSIVTQLVSLERRPIEQLQTQASTIQAKLSSFGLLQSYAGNLRDISDRLAKPEFWEGNAATTSDGASVGVSAASTASAGSYLVSVSALAQAHSLASKAYASSTSSVGTGTLRIEVGTWNDDLTAFTADAAKVPVDITVAAGSDSLDDIMAQINAAHAGVTASIVNDTSGARLVLTSNATGAANAVRITATTDDDGNTADANGLSALAFNPAVVAGQMSQSQAGKNTTATINGLPVSSATNKLENMISGVTLTLYKQTTSPVEVKVAQDTATLKKAVTDFAKAFSDMNVYINQQTKYDAASKKGAALQGDRATLALQNNLRSLFTDSSSASLVYARLSDIGLEIQSDGSMKVNDTKLSAAMAAHPDEVAKLFTSTAASDSSEHGFAVRAKSLTAALISSDGAITTRTKGLRDSITRNQHDQERLEKRVALVQARLTKQYGALDTMMSRISATNSSLSQALSALQAQSEAIAKNR